MNDNKLQLPESLKWTMAFIDRVGFPALAFILMAYMCFVTLRNVTESIDKNTMALARLGEEMKTHQKWSEWVSSGGRK